MGRALRNVAGVALAAAALVACNGVPVRVVRSDPARVQRDVNANILNSDEPSSLSVQVLQRLDLYTAYEEDPVEALRVLHEGLEPTGDRYRLFALAELSYTYAERSGDRSYYLAAALYAYALLFSENPDDKALDPSDPRLRMACDLYNSGLAAALATGKHGESSPETGSCRRAGTRPDKSRPLGGYRLRIQPAADFEVVANATARASARRRRRPVKAEGERPRPPPHPQERKVPVTAFARARAARPPPGLPSARTSRCTPATSSAVEAGGRLRSSRGQLGARLHAGRVALVEHRVRELLLRGGEPLNKGSATGCPGAAVRKGRIRWCWYTNRRARTGPT